MKKLKLILAIMFINNIIFSQEQEILPIKLDEIIFIPLEKKEAKKIIKKVKKSLEKNYNSNDSLIISFEENSIINKKTNVDKDTIMNRYIKGELGIIINNYKGFKSLDKAKILKIDTSTYMKEFNITFSLDEENIKKIKENIAIKNKYEFIIKRNGKIITKEEYTDSLKKIKFNSCDLFTIVKKDSNNNTIKIDTVKVDEDYTNFINSSEIYPPFFIPNISFSISLASTVKFFPFIEDISDYNYYGYDGDENYYVIKFEPKDTLERNIFKGSMIINKKDNAITNIRYIQCSKNNRYKLLKNPFFEKIIPFTSRIFLKAILFFKGNFRKLLNSIEGEVISWSTEIGYSKKIINIL